MAMANSAASAMSMALEPTAPQRLSANSPSVLASLDVTVQQQRVVNVPGVSSCYKSLACGQSWQERSRGSRRSRAGTSKSSYASSSGRWGRPDGPAMARATAEDGSGRKEDGGKPLKIMIAGAPASGKGTQCQMVVEKFALSHVSTGDLLRLEVAAGSEPGKVAKAYMDAGKLVPTEIVTAMVKKKLAEGGGGWLLDGYPRSLEQAQALEAIEERPQLFVVLEVPDEVLVERAVGRRYDPATGNIYHLKYFPPETEEIASRLTHRLDDTEEKVRTRLATHHANMQAVTGLYEGIVKRVDGNRSKTDVFADIARLLGEVQDEVKPEGVGINDRGLGLAETKLTVNGSSPSVESDTVTEEKLKEVVPKGVPKDKDVWIGVPTKLNMTPHSGRIRNYFYADVCNAVKNAVEDGLHQLRVQVTIPELNPEMDVFRIGTLLELVREMAFTFANDGKRVRVSVQGAMGEGIFRGLPLQLAGVRQLLDRMDWGEYGADAFINIGAVGAAEVQRDDDVFILVAPQNTVANCIMDDLKAMVDAAGDRPLIIVNPRLKDVPGSGGVMQVQGRENRLEFTKSFFICYNFRLLYQSGSFYPILGALRKAYPSPYQIYRRYDRDTKTKEEYVLLPDTFDQEPTSSEISDAYYGVSRKQAPQGIWGFLSRILN